MQKLRLVEKEDLLLIFNWANDPEVRNNGFNTASISLKDHEQWFNNKIENPQTLFLLFEKDGQPAGQIRYEFEKSEIVINYMIASEFRGQGLGISLLLEGEKYLINNNLVLSGNKIVGFVKPDNIASIKSFEKAGYVRGNNENPATGYKFEKYI